MGFLTTNLNWCVSTGFLVASTGYHWNKPWEFITWKTPRKQAFLDAQEDDFNSAVDRTRITSLEKLKDVWKAAENLHARTPKSFTFRMSKVLTQAWVWGGQNHGWKQRKEKEHDVKKHFVGI